MRKKSILLLVLLAPGFAMSETLDFKEVWGKIRESSSAIESSELMTNSVAESKKRSARHWLPRIYLDSKSYSTNQPAAAFVGLLEQKAVQTSDFAASSLNNPETKTFTRTAIGVDWPLYEGGMKSSYAELETNRLASQEHEAKQIILDQYTEVAKMYSGILVLGLQKKKLEELNAELSKMIKSYQLGSRSNPVGYSGLLGMRSLQNRIQGLLKQFDAQQVSYQNALKEMGLKTEKWQPKFLDVEDFAQKFLTPSKTLVSYKIKSLKDQSKMSAEVANMEKARYLPRIGLFAESQVFKGDRDTTNSNMAGVYLQWNLFNATDWGAYKEAKLKSAAVEKMAEATAQQNRAELLGLTEALGALKMNLELLNESEKLMMEQTIVTQDLFRNGSINALQFVEVLNRRVDLIYQKSEVEMSYLKTAAQSVRLTEFDPSNLESQK